MANFTAVFDACVLYPAPLRDLLLSVVTTKQLQRTVALMNQAVPDCLVENYEILIDALTLPDPNDRHVLAAAIKCQADVIVTNNLKDFPNAIVGHYDIDVQTPDVFLSHLYDLNPAMFFSAVRQQRERLANPAYTAEELLDVFYNQGLPLTVGKLGEVVDLL